MSFSEKMSYSNTAELDPESSYVNVENKQAENEKMLAQAKSLLEEEGLQFEKLLGKGNFGEVWKASYTGTKYGTNVRTVAVKLQLGSQVTSAEKEFSLTHGLENKNVVRLFDFHHDAKALIMEVSFTLQLNWLKFSIFLVL